MKKIALLLLISLFVVSCNLPISINWNSKETEEPIVVAEITEAPIQPTPEVVIPDATQTEAAQPTEAAPSELPIDGTLVESNGMSFVMPSCLAGTASIETIPAEEIDPNAPSYFYRPQHRLVTITGYPLQDKFFEPEIYIFPIADFDAAGVSMASEVNQLNTFISTQNMQPEGGIPMLPVFPAAQVFKSQVSYFDFQSGKGIRFLTEFAQYFAPINNYELVYTYQGLTADGKYWISAILPINATFLQEMPDSAVQPDGGITPPSYDSPTLDKDLETYYAAIDSQLMMNDNFIPDIHCLDQLVASIKIDN